MPYIGLLVHRALNARGLLPMDPMIQFILLMQPAMPAAMQATPRVRDGWGDVQSAMPSSGSMS